MLRATSPPGQNGSVPVTVSTTEGSSPAIERFADTFTYFGPAPDVPGDEATTYHVDPQHVGSVSGDSLVLPTRRRWSADLGGTVSYPLVTGGRVYILAKTGASTTGLEALDAVTGATAWGPVPTGTGLVLTYDRGMIFTLAADGTTRAFDAATGSAQWSRAMGGSPRSLIAADGTLYASDPASSGVTALSESTGATLWTSSVPPIGSPAVRGRVIYPNAGSCPGSPALRTQDGSHLWQGSGLCALTPDGPGVSLYRGRLYGSGRVADALTGQQVGAAPGLSLSLLSTFVGDTRISVNFGAPGATDPNRRIEATDLGTRATTWSDLMPSVVAYAPITVNGVVYDATVDGQVYGIDAATGVTRWSDATAQALTAETLWGDASTPVTGLAAGEGMLLVPAGNLLIAYDSQASEVAASVGPSHTLAEYNSNTGHRSLGGYILGAPAVVAIPQPSGPPKVFYVAAGPGGTLWTRSDSDKWQRLVSGTQPINCQDSVGAAVAGPSLVVACKGTDGALWTGTATIGAGPPVSAAASWMTLGGQLVAGPAVGQVNGSTNFFVTGTDQQVWQRTATSGWAPTGWRCAGHPALVGVQSLSYFACRGIDRTLMISQAQAGAWAPLRSVGGQLVDGPGIAASAAGAVYFVEGTDRGLWRLDLRAQTAGGWVRVGSDAGQGASATSVAAP
jgi:outer membrane protein assembly factor BamB